MNRPDHELAINYLVSGGVVAYQRAIAHAVGDALAGLLFSQLWYWSGRQPEERKGWFFMTQDQILAETAMTRREQETSRRKLRALGILEEERRGRPAKLWYRINVKKVVQLIENTARFKDGGKRQTSLAENAKQVCTIPPNKYGGKRQTISKNTSKNTSKNSATAQVAPFQEFGNTDAAAELILIKELTSHGVGRTAAVALAREKPELCRRYLGYLPFADIRTTKGAWLTNAIRDEYGPPQAYVDAKQKEGQRIAAKQAAEVARSRITQEDARHQTIPQWVRTSYGRMKSEQGTAFLAFTAHLAQERKKSEKMAEQLSAPRQAEYLASFDSEEHRMELFARWLERQNRAPVGSLEDREMRQLLSNETSGGGEFSLA